MSASDSNPFPLAQLHAIANARNEWVALSLQLPPAPMAALATLYAKADGLAAALPFDCIIALADPALLTAGMLALLPAGHTIFRFPVGACSDKKNQENCRQLVHHGYRILLDDGPGAGAQESAAQGISVDCALLKASGAPPLVLPGPHLARNVATARILAECRSAGFTWFSGSYPLYPERDGAGIDDGISRKRLLTLLGLLARDADSDALETLLKQDPALSYHLFKLVNCAAIAHSAPIHHFGQAINLLGRRQLQRWLQLLLYARKHADGSSNLLLPLAAVRAAQMEALCRIGGGDHDRQEMAFMTGVFSLLDVLLDMPMADIVGALGLHLEVGRALLGRSGALGHMLALVASDAVTQGELDHAAIDAETYWRSLLPAYQWAIHVSRNL